MKKVSVLLALYKPNKIYLQKQLRSIEYQTYKNVEVFILDDSGINIKINLLDIISKELRKTKFHLFSNSKNLGSNKSFDILTKIADGDYFAYCDQDDIWADNKIEKLVNKLESESAVTCYSDLSVIDQNDSLINKSFKKYSRRIKHVYGINKYNYFFHRNSITGCSMLIKSYIAKSALPFPDYKVYVHDHWLAIFSSCVGKISYINEPLVHYRIHENNQIGNKIMEEIFTKKDYIEKKIVPQVNRTLVLKEKGINKMSHDIDKKVESYTEFLNGREKLLRKKKIKFIPQLIAKDPVLITVEVLIAFLPFRISRKLVSLLK